MNLYKKGKIKYLLFYKNTLLHSKTIISVKFMIAFKKILLNEGNSNIFIVFYIKKYHFKFLSFSLSIFKELSFN